jgi:ribosomal protein S18 acetylase RimI-like enzyme
LIDMTVTTRDGTADDDAICGQIIGASAGGSIYADRLPHARDLFEDVSARHLDGKLRMVAEIDSKTLGFADYTIAKGHIKYLFVLPASQGSGAGAALLNAVQARVGDAISIHVLAVNDVGILWYLRRGFRVVDGWAEPLEGKMAAWLRMVRDA